MAMAAKHFLNLNLIHKNICMIYFGEKRMLYVYVTYIYLSYKHPQMILVRPLRIFWNIAMCEKKWSSLINVSPKLLDIVATVATHMEILKNPIQV